MNDKYSQVYFKQYGAERTGTNYLKLLIERNIPDACVFPSVFGWKHSVPMDHKAWLNRADKGDRIMSVDGKTSLPYSRKFLDDVLSQGLIYLVSAKDPYAAFVSFCKFSPKSITNDESVSAWAARYNRRYKAWLDLLENNPGLAVRYEDLAQSPEIEIGKIASAFNLNLVENFIDENNVVGPGSDWKVPVASRKFNRRYYVERQYLAELRDERRKRLTDNIDWTIFARLNYEPVS